MDRDCDEVLVLDAEEISEERALAVRAALTPATVPTLALVVELPVFEVVARDVPTSIGSQEEADAMVALIRELNDEKARVEAAFKPIADRANKFHRGITGMRGSYLARTESALAVANSAVGAWERAKAKAAEEESKRRATEERERREREAEAARKAEEEARRERVAEAENEAEHFWTMEAPEVAMQILDSIPSAVPAIRPTFALASAPVAVAPTSGVSVSSKWVGRVTDKGAFLRWVGEDAARGGLVEIKQGKVNELAKTLKGSVAIPGLEQVEESAVRVR